MSARDFTVDVFRDGDAVVVAPYGELDLRTVSVLRDELTAQPTGVPLVLDLRGVTFMDSAGLALMVEQQRRAGAEGVDFRVAPGPEMVQKLFEVTGVARHLRWTEVPSLDGNDAGKEGERVPLAAEAGVNAPPSGDPGRR
jgi:anti-anti-sigma factor